MRNMLPITDKTANPLNRVNAPQNRKRSYAQAKKSDETNPARAGLAKNTRHAAEDNFFLLFVVFKLILLLSTD